MSGKGKFKKQLSLMDLTFIGLGAIFGSGWLFAASHVSAIAGPAGIFSWLLGGFSVLLLGIVYCELGAALPRAGGVIRYPVYSHGPLLGYLMGFITLIAFSSLVAIEVVAARQYAAACKAGEVRTGHMFITQPAELDGPRWIVNFPTKQHWRSPSQLAWVVEGLQDLRQFLIENNVQSIAIPPLGAGNGGPETGQEQGKGAVMEAHGGTS